MNAMFLKWSFDLKTTVFLWLLLIPVFSLSRERIESFHADIKIDDTAEITIKEYITIYATGNVFKRGIVRSLPLKRKDSTGRSIPVDYEIISIRRDGSQSDYHIKKESGFKNIYVGNKSVYLTPGSYTYEIEYVTKGQLRYFSEYDELYWNVNGTEWTVPFDQISATIFLPDGASEIQSSCYTGAYGSTLTDCAITRSGNLINFYFKTPRLGDNLTVATGFTKGVVYQPPPPPPPKPPTFFEKYGAQIITALFAFLLFIYYFITWRRYGIDPPKPTVYPQFEAPQNLSPASTGMVRKGRYWTDLLTASIINLGVKGYLKINEEEKKYIFGLFKDKVYEIEKIKETTNDLPKEEQLIMNNLFGIGNKKIIDGQYSLSMESLVDQYQGIMNGQWRKFLNKGNNLGFIAFPILVTGLYFVSFLFLATVFRSEYAFAYFFGFLFVNAILFILYVWLIRKATVEKLQLKSEIEGFEMYLGTAEEKQLQHFNSPEMTPEIFEKLLPYAIVLGVDDVWGKKFQSMLSKMSMGEKYQSTWTNYSGNNFGGFTHTLNSSLSNSIAHSSATPSSSGSGGGGFSGGGGGGGGGGGW